MSDWIGKYGCVKYAYSDSYGHPSYYCSMYMWLVKDKCFNGRLLKEYPLYKEYSLKIYKNLVEIYH